MHHYLFNVQRENGSDELWGILDQPTPEEARESLRQEFLRIGMDEHGHPDVFKIVEDGEFYTRDIGGCMRFDSADEVESRADWMPGMLGEQE